MLGTRKGVLRRDRVDAIPARMTANISPQALQQIE
jgi:hypothetical protein